MISIQFFEEQIRNILHKNCRGLLNWSAEVVVAISRPSIFVTSEDFLNQIEQWEFSYKFRRNVPKNLILKLSILKWYLPEEARIVLDTLIEDKIEHFHLDDDIRFNLISKNKGECLIYLYEKYKNRPNEFFGWLLQPTKYKDEKSIPLNSVEKTLPIRFWKRKTKPVYPKRKRGYDDKGHLGSDFSKSLKNICSDISIKEAVLRELERKQRIQSTTELVRGFLF